MTHSSRRRVLLVEDVDLMAGLYGRRLAEAGWTVDRARTGAEALALAKNGVHEAIVLDLTLPDMTGIEVLSALASACEGADVPVVVLTNSADAPALDAASSAGASAVLIKSMVTTDDVVATINRVTGKR